ncbi:MAG: response regulator [Arachnia sp.]
MPPVIRVLVAEDDPLARHAIETYLARANDIELLEMAHDGEAAVRMAQELKPDVAIVDIHMPKLDGVEVARELSKPPLNCKVVCFTALGDETTMMDALAAGASGFLLKSDNPGLILHGVRSAYSGDSLVSPKLVAELLRHTPARSRPPVHLSDADRHLLTLIGRGLSNAEIAEELYLSPATVKTYVSRLLARLERPNRTSLAALAHEWGLVT